MLVLIVPCPAHGSRTPLVPAAQSESHVTLGESGEPGVRRLAHVASPRDRAQSEGITTEQPEIIQKGSRYRGDEKFKEGQMTDTRVTSTQS